MEDKNNITNTWVRWTNIFLPNNARILMLIAWWVFMTSFIKLAGKMEALLPFVDTQEVVEGNHCKSRLGSNLPFVIYQNVFSTFLTIHLSCANQNSQCDRIYPAVLVRSPSFVYDLLWFVFYWRNSKWNLVKRQWSEKWC